MTSIAIVDGVKSNRQILSKIIESMNTNISVYDLSEVSAAFNLIADRTPNLMITDYNLPGMDGIRFIEQLRSLPTLRKIPILMITSDNNVLLPTRAYLAGVTVFLHRPFNHKLVRARIGNLLRSQKYPRLVIDNTLPCGSA